MLTTDGYEGLAYSTTKFGGLNYFGEKLGIKVGKKPNGYWNLSKIYEQLDEFENFPTVNQLKKYGRHDLLRAISRLGGFVEVKEKYEAQTLHS